MKDLTYNDKTVLGIETSGKVASCAVMRGGVLIGESGFVTALTHSQVILPLLERTLSDCALNLSDVDLFAVAAGPGSYTGLRIGIAAVKGICALGKPCIGVSTLEALAYSASAARGLIIPALSARKDVAYYGGYLSDGEKIEPYAEDRVGDESGIKALADGFSGEIILTGDAADRLKETLFKDDSRVRTAPANIRQQSAAGVCMAALNRPGDVTDSEHLGARYLQNTMAEKLKDRGDAR